jgi:hypothetical protein
MQNATSYVQQYNDYATGYNGWALVDAMKRHPEIPIATASAYVAFVFGGQAFMKNRSPPPLRWVNVAWNFILAVFSIAGALVTMPYLVKSVATKGFYYSMCEPSENWYFNGPTGLWVGLFILSKIPEMFDTVLLVLQKKPVILLHWYHHFTVMLYCWHAWTNTVAPGIWFAAMNFTVHALMYSYYFMMSLSAVTRKMAKPFAQMITSLQLLQMVFGMVVSLTAAYYIHISGSPCHQDVMNNVYANVMYGSYFVLFAMLFKKLYLSGPRKKKTA